MVHVPGESFLAARAELGVFLFRLFLGVVLVYGTQDNVFSGERMMEFRGFLAGNGFPYPDFCAYLSVWAQFICGILITVGFGTRIAAAVMAVNFLVALVMVHRNLPFSSNIAPLAMFFGSVLFLFHGAGRWSVDERFGRRARPARVPLSPVSA